MHGQRSWPARNCFQSCSTVSIAASHRRKRLCALQQRPDATITSQMRFTSVFTGTSCTELQCSSTRSFCTLLFCSNFKASTQHNESARPPRSRPSSFGVSSHSLLPWPLPTHLLHAPLNHDQDSLQADGHANHKSDCVALHCDTSSSRNLGLIAEALQPRQPQLLERHIALLSTPLPCGCFCIIAHVCDCDISPAATAGFRRHLACQRIPNPRAACAIFFTSFHFDDILPVCGIVDFAAFAATLETEQQRLPEEKESCPEVQIRRSRAGGRDREIDKGTEGGVDRGWGERFKRASGRARQRGQG